MFRALPKDLKMVTRPNTGGGYRIQPRATLTAADIPRTQTTITADWGIEAQCLQPLSSPAEMPPPQPHAPANYRSTQTKYQNPVHKMQPIVRRNPSTPPPPPRKSGTKPEKTAPYAWSNQRILSETVTPDTSYAYHAPKTLDC